MVEKTLEAQGLSETVTNNFDKCVMSGICIKDLDQTSTAMKYLICKGSTFPVKGWLSKSWWHCTLNAFTNRKTIRYHYIR